MSLEATMLEAQASLGKLTDTCETCRGIWLCFLDPTISRRVSLGYTDDPLHPRCAGHSPLYLYWREESKPDPPDGVSAIDSSDEGNSSSIGDSDGGANRETLRETRADGANQIMIQTEHSPKSVILTKKTTEDFEICQEIMMLKKNSVSGHPGIGIRLDPDWIDIQLARKWKQVCLEEHGMKCNNPLKISPVNA